MTEKVHNATVHLEDGSEIEADTVEIDPGWVTVQYWDVGGTEQIHHIPVNRIERVVEP